MCLKVVTLDRGQTTDVFPLLTATSVKRLDLFTGGKHTSWLTEVYNYVSSTSVSMMSGQALEMQVSLHHLQSVSSAPKDSRVCSLSLSR